MLVISCSNHHICVEKQQNDMILIQKYHIWYTLLLQFWQSCAQEKTFMQPYKQHSRKCHISCQVHTMKDIIKWLKKLRSSSALLIHGNAHAYMHSFQLAKLTDKVKRASYKNLTSIVYFIVLKASGYNSRMKWKLTYLLFIICQTRSFVPLVCNVMLRIF